MSALALGSLDMGPYLCVFLLAVFVGLLATRAVRDLAIRRGWIAAPSLARHMHRKPVPRIGGVAIYVSTWLAVLAVVGMLSVTNANEARAAEHRLLPILAAGTLIFAVGLLDDFRNLRATT